MLGCQCSGGRFGLSNQPVLEEGEDGEGLISCYQYREKFAALTTNNRQNITDDKTSLEKLTYL